MSAPLLLLHQLEAQVGLRVCEHPFSAVMRAAPLETWTGDPFDRVIVAHARSNGYAPQLTSDSRIQENYPNTVW